MKWPGVTDAVDEEGVKNTASNEALKLFMTYDDNCDMVLTPKQALYLMMDHWSSKRSKECDACFKDVNKWFD